MKFRVVYGPHARLLVRRLPPDLKPVVNRAIELLKTDPYAGKELKLELAGYRSLRTQRYRVIYRLDRKLRETQILYFGRRADVYESFHRLLRQSADPTEALRESGPRGGARRLLASRKRDRSKDEA